MVSLAGMDLGYGSQVQLVRTNYLYVAAESAKGGTNAQQATFLQLFNQTLNKNQTGGGLHPLTCDYLISEVAGSGANEPTVLGASATGLALPLMGPSKASLADQSGLSGSGFEHASSEADQGSSANGHILAILASSVVDITISVSSSVATIDSAAALDTLIGTGGTAGALTSALMAQTVDEAVDGGVASGNALAAFVPMGDLHTDLTAAAATGAVHVDETPTSPVFKGNAAGTTASDLGSITGVNAADNIFVITLIGLVKAY